MDQIARTPKQIGQAIRRARRNIDATQSQLGEKAMLRQETVSKIEGGNKAARIESICDLLTALDLELVIRSRTSGDAKDIEDIF